MREDKSKTEPVLSQTFHPDISRYLVEHEMSTIVYAKNFVVEVDGVNPFYIQIVECDLVRRCLLVQPFVEQLVMPVLMISSVP